MARAIGIDLGTTNSCAAVMDSQRPRVITYKGGGSTIPSVFAIDDSGNRLVGQEAKRQAQLNPANTVMASKRLIGRNFHSKTIDKVKQVFTYEMLEGENKEVLITPLYQQLQHVGGKNAQIRAHAKINWEIVDKALLTVQQAGYKDIELMALSNVSL